MILEILQDPSFSKTESELLSRFAQAATTLAERTDVTNTDVWNLSTISTKADVLISRFSKESPVKIALWVIFYSLTKAYFPDSNRFKYPNVEAFLTKYSGGRFDDFDIETQEILKNEANWFNIVFDLLPARKNKGLCMAVVPRIVEGWSARYVTGSGQTKATADRVCIFESEGDVQPSHRGGRIISGRKSPSAAWRRKKRLNGINKSVKPTVASSDPSAPATGVGAAGGDVDTFPTACIHHARMEHKRLSSNLARAERIITRRGSKERFLEVPTDRTIFSAVTPAAFPSTESETYPFPEFDTDVEFDDVDDVSMVDHDVFVSADPLTASTVCSSSTNAGAPHQVPISPPCRLPCNVGSLGGSNFQPLFDFGFSMDRTLGRTGCVAPPYLKRAFSWEYYHAPEAPQPAGEGAPHPYERAPVIDENQVNALIPFSSSLPSAERATSKAFVTDFLFDEFLSSTTHGEPSVDQPC